MPKNSKSLFCTVKPPKQTLLGCGVIVACLFFLGCGRKPRSIIPSDEKAPLQRINRLSFPAVTGITRTDTQKGAHISWYAMALTSVPKQYQLEGYNIYRLGLGGFLPEFPLNKTIITTTFYHDENPPKKYRGYYLIRAVFTKENSSENIQEFLEGPTSEIA